MFYSLNTGRSIAERYAPLIHAAMEIKLEATIAHLRFEESISGDLTLQIDDVWKHLDQAEWYARAMLYGGENRESKLVPLEIPVLRRGIGRALGRIDAFRSIAHERRKTQSQSTIGSDIDQRLDGIFKDLLTSVDEAEMTLQRTMERQLERFHLIERLLVIVVVLSGVAIAIVLHRHDRSRVRDMLAPQ